MLTKTCGSCEYCFWVVGIGFGVRCKHQDNQKYLKSGDRNIELPVIISNIPDGCEYYKSIEK